MGRPSQYPRELRERAVRMVAEVRPDYPSEYAAMTAVPVRIPQLDNQLPCRWTGRPRVAGLEDRVPFGRS